MSESPDILSFMPSGLKGQALNISLEDIPSRSEVRSVIPKHCFNRQTHISLSYLALSVGIQFFVVLLGLSIPLTKSMIP